MSFRLIACASWANISARIWLVGVNRRDLLATPCSFANRGIRFRGINLKICPNTVRLCFDGFISQLLCFLAGTKDTENPSLHQTPPSLWDASELASASP